MTKEDMMIAIVHAVGKRERKKNVFRSELNFSCIYLCAFKVQVHKGTSHQQIIHCPLDLKILFYVPKTQRNFRLRLLA